MHKSQYIIFHTHISLLCSHVAIYLFSPIVQEKLHSTALLCHTITLHLYHFILYLHSLIPNPFYYYDLQNNPPRLLALNISLLLWSSKPYLILPLMSLLTNLKPHFSTDSFSLIPFYRLFTPPYLLYSSQTTTYYCDRPMNTSVFIRINDSFLHRVLTALSS